MTVFNLYNEDASFISNSSSANFSYLKDTDNILKDINIDSKIFQVWRAYQKRKQETLNYNNKHNHALSNFKEEMLKTPVDDIVCIVCNDGDYEENDLIVYCSVNLIYN